MTKKKLPPDLDEDQVLSDFRGALERMNGPTGSAWRLLSQYIDLIARDPRIKAQPAVAGFVEVMHTLASESQSAKTTEEALLTLREIYTADALAPFSNGGRTKPATKYKEKALQIFDRLRPYCNSNEDAYGDVVELIAREGGSLTKRTVGRWVKQRNTPKI